MNTQSTNTNNEQMGARHQVLTAQQLSAQEPSTTTQQLRMNTQLANSSTQQYRLNVQQPRMSVQQSSTNVQQPKLCQQPSTSIQQPSRRVQQPRMCVHHPSTSLQQPKLSVQQPSTSLQQPSTRVQQSKMCVHHSSTSIQQPSTSIQQASASIQPSSTRVHQSSSNVQQPKMCVHHPSSGIQQPSTSVQQSSTSVQQPRISVQHLSTSAQQSRMSVQQPSTSVQQPSVSCQQSSVNSQQSSMSTQQINVHSQPITIMGTQPIAMNINNQPVSLHDPQIAMSMNPQLMNINLHPQPMPFNLNTQHMMNMHSPHINVHTQQVNLIHQPININAQHLNLHSQQMGMTTQQPYNIQQMRLHQQMAAQQMNAQQMYVNPQQSNANSQQINMNSQSTSNAQQLNDEEMISHHQPPPEPVDREKICQWLLEINDPQTRENALVELGKRRDYVPDLAVLIWHSFGTATALLQEVMSIYSVINPAVLSASQSNRVCNALALLQCVAAHPETRPLLIAAQIPLFLYPFLHTISKNRPFEYLRLTCLGVIGALVKQDEPEVIQYLLDTEIIPLCLRIMECGSELSKIVATFILQKILANEKGLNYVCETYERFSHIAMILGKLVLTLAAYPSTRLLKHVVRCYLRLSEHPRAREALQQCIPDQLADATFIECLQDEPVTRSWIAELLANLGTSKSYYDPRQLSKSSTSTTPH